MSLLFTVCHLFTSESLAWSASFNFLISIILQLLSDIEHLFHFYKQISWNYYSNMRLSFTFQPVEDSCKVYFASTYYEFCQINRLIFQPFRYVSRYEIFSMFYFMVIIEECLKFRKKFEFTFHFLVFVYNDDLT